MAESMTTLCHWCGKEIAEDERHTNESGEHMHRDCYLEELELWRP